MKKTLIISIAVLLLAFVVYSQTSRETGQLTFTLTPIKNRVLLLEPIPLKFGIENRTGGTLSLAKPPSLQRLKLSLQKPDGKEVTVDRLTYSIANDYSNGWDVPAGAKHDKTEVLEFELLKWFDQAGQYRVKALLQNGDSLIQTDWATLTVEEPTGADVAAFEYLKGIQEPSVILSAPMGKREEFLERFPDSSYSDYLRYSLAGALASRDKARSLELYKRIQANPSFVFSEQVNGQIKRLEPTVRASQKN